jgi:hypothetical protein
MIVQAFLLGEQAKFAAVSSTLHTDEENSTVTLFLKSGAIRLEFLVPTKKARKFEASLRELCTSS